MAMVSASRFGHNNYVYEFCTIRDSTMEDDCKIYERVTIRGSELHSGVIVKAGASVESAKIGERVKVGQNCSIIGNTHNYSKQGLEYDVYFNLITIEEMVVIGAGSIILPGITVGKHSVIAPGSVVGINIPSHHEYIGNSLNDNFRLSEIK